MMVSMGRIRVRSVCLGFSNRCIDWMVSISRFCRNQGFVRNIKVVATEFGTTMFSQKEKSGHFLQKTRSESV